MKKIIIPTLLVGSILLIASKSTSKNKSYKDMLIDHFRNSVSNEDLNYLDSKLKLMSSDEVYFFYEIFVLKKYAAPLVGDVLVKFDTLTEKYQIFN